MYVLHRPIEVATESGQSTTQQLILAYCISYYSSLLLKYFRYDMTTCVVAQFPWTAIRNVTKLETKGIIVCSDTRLTTNEKPIEGIYSKQGKLSSNHYICFTSSNLSATLEAISKVDNTKSVKRIGNALRVIHGECGGFTQMIVIVSHIFHPARILELTPPNYTPKRRTGVIGIGNKDVLELFKKTFSNNLDQTFSSHRFR